MVLVRLREARARQGLGDRLEHVDEAAGDDDADADALAERDIVRVDAPARRVLCDDRDQGAEQRRPENDQDGSDVQRLVIVNVVEGETAVGRIRRPRAAGRAAGAAGRSRARRRAGRHRRHQDDTEGRH